MARSTHSGYSDQSKASKHRLKDAEVLHTAKRWRGAMYLAGYSVECLLKAKLMQIFGCLTLQALEGELQRRGLLPANATIYTHQLEHLLNLTRSDGRLRQNPTAWRRFVLVNRWTPSWRYSPDHSTEQVSEAYLDAVRDVLHWIEHNI